VGTGGYLTAELFKSVTGIDAAIIPYKGTAQVMNDLLGNHVPIAFGVLPPALGNLQAGTLRAIAVLGPTRFSLLPDVPTADESGLPGFESCCITGCWRRRARRGRSSSASTLRCARWRRAPRSSSASWPKAAIH
jgi:tripartite-type tricarboxylate transporter receptor subunit TctC